MSKLYSYLPKGSAVMSVRCRERLAAVSDWAVCSGFAPGAPVRLLDATVVMAMLASVGVLIRIADTSSDRNPSADAIAQKFSAPNLVRETFDAVPVLANLEARLGFVPVEAMLWKSAPTPVEPALIRLAALDDERGSRSPGLDPLSVLILRDLPEESQLSSGTAVSLTAWALAVGDLDKLVVTLGKSSDRPVLASIEFINPVGFAEAAVQIEIRRQANIHGDEGAATAAKAAPPKVEPPKAEAEDNSQHQPRRYKAVHKRRGARRAPTVHRVVREVKAVARRAPTALAEKSSPAAQATPPLQTQAGPAFEVINGIGKIISGFGLATSVPPDAASFAPKAP